MGAGHWLNPTTGQCEQVTTHDEWIRDKENANEHRSGRPSLPQIMLLPATDNAAWSDPRSRSSRRSDSNPPAQAVHLGAILGDERPGGCNSPSRLADLGGTGVHPDERLQIDNLCLGESASVTLRALQNDQAVFQHQLDTSSAGQVIVGYGVAGGS